MKCAYCGKAVRKNTVTVRAPREPNTIKPVKDWRYDGNLQIVSREYWHILTSPNGTEVDRYEQVRSGNDVYDNSWKRHDRMKEEPYTGWTYEKRLRAVTVWDGESYLPSYKYFCTNNCAGWFACTAVERLTQRKAS